MTKKESFKSRENAEAIYHEIWSLEREQKELYERADIIRRRLSVLYKEANNTEKW